MGADIHLYVEKKENGKWISVDTWYEEEDFKHSDNPFYDDRNYDLFAILADVHNGRGFGGCDTGDGFTPISMPRGLPADVSAEVGQVSAQWDSDGHSHSWLTLEELLNWNHWDDVTTNRGYLSEDDYLKWDKKGEPQSYSGGIYGNAIVSMGEKEYLNLMKNGTRVELKPTKYYINVSWKQSYRECVRNFWTETIPKLQKVDANPANVRIVYFFDN